MGNGLSNNPVTDKVGELVTTAWGDIGATGMQGLRGEMEDTHIVSNMPSLPDHTFLAVFDGHGGDGAAIYAAKYMLERIEGTDEWKQYVVDPTKSTVLLGKALTQAFITMDEMMRVHQQLPSNSRYQDCSGCTAVTCMITPDHFVCANAGDSRCCMGTNGQTIALSDDHKPCNPKEQLRIMNAGGSVHWKRVDGDLAVSRGLGDFSFKARDDLPASEQRVSCYPDIRTQHRSSKDDILLLACDGLWDVMSNEEAIAAVRHIFQLGEKCMLLTAEEMTDLSLEKGSQDNISCIVASFDGATFGSADNKGVLGLRAQREALPQIAKVGRHHISGDDFEDKVEADTEVFKDHSDNFVADGFAENS